MSIQQTIDKVYFKCFPHWTEILKREVGEVDSILDLGCGNNSFIHLCKARYKVGVDIFQPYINESRNKGYHDAYYVGDIRNLEFRYKSFDVVMAIALLEHLDETDGYYLLKKMDSIARKKIILTTPNGYIGHEKIDGNEHQAHLSGWTTRELEHWGYRVYGTFGWKPLRGEAGIPRIKPDFLGNMLAETTQYITYHVPELSFVLFAVKDIK